MEDGEEQASWEVEGMPFEISGRRRGWGLAEVDAMGVAVSRSVWTSP